MHSDGTPRERPFEGPGGAQHSLPTGWDQPQPAGPPAPGTARGRPAPDRQYFVPAAPSGDPAAPGGLPPGPGAPPVPPPPGGRPAQRRRLRWQRVLGIAAVVLVVSVLAFGAFGYWQFRRVERIAVGSVLSPPSGSGTNYLIVGSDSREGFDPTDPLAGAVLGEGAAENASERSDTMLILRIHGDGAEMLSIPRDLWVTRSDGTQGRINAAYNKGPETLITTIQASLGIPVHHYVEVDFVTFADLVDAVGGVTIEFPHPAHDPRSGLNVPEAGPARLDGSQALAYVRSRHYSELIDGSWRTDPTGDHGRVQRQQTFLRAVMREVGSTVNPIEVARLSWAMAGGLRIDDRTDFLEALGFARRLRGLTPESVLLPVYGYRTSGGAAVLGLSQPEAAAVLERFAS